jgi:hypothetical protein
MGEPKLPQLRCSRPSLKWMTRWHHARRLREPMAVRFPLGEKSLVGVNTIISDVRRVMLSFRHMQVGCGGIATLFPEWGGISRLPRRRRSCLMMDGNYLALLLTAWRVPSRVLMSDSLGSFSMIGSIAHPSPNGTSRVSEMARHSTMASASRCWNLQ